MASDTLASVSKVLHDIDRAKEVSTAPPRAAHQAGWTLVCLQSMALGSQPWAVRRGSDAGPT